MRDFFAVANYVEAGFWAAVGLAFMVVALAGRLCGGRLVVTLEGGYDLDVLTCGVANTCRALLDDSVPEADPLGPSPWPERPVDDVLRSIKRVHRLDS